MGSKTFDGVRFSAYPDDHPPPHVHAFYAEIRVIVELENGETRLSARPDAVRPVNGKQSDVRHVLRAATRYADELVELWRAARG